VGSLGIHPAVFVRVANAGLTGYVTWKSVETIDSRMLAARRFSAFSFLFGQKTEATPSRAKECVCSFWHNEKECGRD
jgi:hypothetical protein